MQIEQNVPMPELKPKGPRIVWAFKEMQISDCVKIADHDLIGRAQAYCHVYGRQSAKKFMTRIIDGVLHIWRIK
jgi:hypothetical protein